MNESRNYEVSIRVRLKVCEKDREFARLKAEKLLSQNLRELKWSEMETLSIDEEI